MSLTAKGGERTEQHLDTAKTALELAGARTWSDRDVKWIKDKMEKIAGTRDLPEANRRARVLDDWRVENDK